MGHSIIKLNDGTENYYLEWSSTVDAPVTFGMSLDEFKKYYRDEFGQYGFEKLGPRLERVGRKGTSSHLDDDVDDTISHNRAGKNGTCLTKEQIICKRSAPEGSIEGTDPWAEMKAEEAREKLDV